MGTDILLSFSCTDCELLSKSLERLNILIDEHKEAMNLDELSQFKTDFNRNSEAILNWKRHQLRSVHQDHARDHVLDQLDGSSVFIVMDWAMKWLETKYREKQSEWFGKKGLPWHLVVVIRRQRVHPGMAVVASSKVFEHRTLCHVFDQCKQDALSIVSILKDVLVSLKMDDQALKFVYLRSDNGACYHSTITTTAVKEIQDSTGVFIRRIDFSEPQAGKGPCDRRAAVIKGEVRRYIDEKHNCTNSTEFVAAAKSTSHLSLFSSKFQIEENNSSLTNTSNRSPKATWPGIASIFNIEYEFIPIDQASSSSTNRTSSNVSYASEIASFD